MRTGFLHRYHQHHTVRGFHRLDFGKQAGPGHIVDGFHQCLRVALGAARNGAVIFYAKQQNAALCICQRNRTFHRKLFALPVVLALHPRLKLLPGAFPGSNHFAECLFGHGWDLLSFQPYPHIAGYSLMNYIYSLHCFRNCIYRFFCCCKRF